MPPPNSRRLSKMKSAQAIIEYESIEKAAKVVLVQILRR
jgi:hypothetical protein